MIWRCALLVAGLAGLFLPTMMAALALHPLLTVAACFASAILITTAIVLPRSKR